MLRDSDGGERSVKLHAGEVFVVPRGVEHTPSSPGGAIILTVPPSPGRAPAAGNGCRPRRYAAVARPARR